VASIQGNPGEIRELARYEVRPDALEQCLAAIYPNCLAPVEFVEYKQIDANATFRRV